MNFLQILAEEYNEKDDFVKLDNVYKTAFAYHDIHKEHDPKLTRAVQDYRVKLTKKYKTVKDSDIPKTIDKLTNSRENFKSVHLENKKGYHGQIFRLIDEIRDGLRDRADSLKNKEIEATPEDTYKGEHEAPDHTNGSPLHNLNGIYPEDIYSSHGGKYYGDGSPYDHESMNVIQNARDKPNAKIKVYRAVPLVMTHSEKINDLENQKRYILKTGKVPTGVKTSLNSSKYYDKISDDLENLHKNVPSEEHPKITINSGDWVTGSRAYAVAHGRDNLNNSFRVLSKTVPAKHLYTDGNSIHEFGYDTSK